MFEGFEEDIVDLGDSSVFVRHAGEGTPIVLLHGHPRTSATWHRIAPQLVRAGFRVLCPDVRGYGRSRGPAPSPDHAAHGKRAAAGDVLDAMRRLGVPRFHLVGHDRGSYVAMRLALDHPDAVDRLVLMDCIPISEHLSRADARFATHWWHWFFFAQPDIPERVIQADPEAWYRPKADPATMGPENHAELMSAVSRPETVRAMLEDYRAGLTVDRAHELADRAAGRRIASPLLLLWALRDDLEELVGDPREIWREWAEEVDGHGIDSGHHQAEEAPDAVAAALRDFFG
ncbi:alpha/beta fold hydrolase [Agromyces mediolanus]|uniref:alpha/beta fold hydrolase n=1 Tax=Agromyces mediolanus TaxID=41986 RepID=UPI001E5C607D|nr:alpha/beta hydrolase [Agromyces mediolanus]MCD1571214.1 alpha/beta hydrolase [Agromyces mediolanus]